MEKRMVQVPITLLKDPDQPASVKVLWMVKRLHPDAGPAELQPMLGLSRPTILQGLERLTSLSKGGIRVKVPAALLVDGTLGAQAKVLYALLQTLPTFHGRGGHFTYSALARQTRLNPKSLKRAMTELVRQGWCLLSQISRVRPIHFMLSNPERTRNAAEIALVAQRLKRAKLLGEALAQEWLSLLIDSEEFTDNARPGFLVNPLTEERMELDRLYLQKVGIEFHGAQHDRATERYTEAEVKEQQLRDYIKAGICLYRGIHLVIIRSEDLSLAGMLLRLGNCLPLRDLAGKEGLIEYLEEESVRYQVIAEAARQAGR